MKVNVIAVFNPDKSKILMCLRSKEPYKGLYNLVGGKIEPGEEGLDSAYRELFEETGISQEDIVISHLMNFNYIISDIELQVYAGTLNKKVEVIEEENKLFWVDSNNNFFDMKIYAGEGNIGHMVEHVKMYKDRVL
jgi:8-oxo-dGTP diphosphatase